MLPPTDLLKWVRTQLTELSEDGGIDRFELFHAVEGEGLERCQIWRKVQDCDADELSEEIFSIAEQDANTRSREVPQRYILHAMWGEDREPNSVFPFVLQGRGVLNYSGGNTEPANEKGVIAHMMRHDERLHNLLTQITEVTAGRMAREIDQLQKRAHSAEAQLLETYKLQQDLLDRKHERDLARVKEERATQRHDEIMSFVMSMAPLIASQLLGGKATAKQLPAKSARDDAVGRFIGGLSETEVKNVLSALAQHNQIALLELYQSYQADYLKKQGNSNGDTKETAKEEKDVQETGN